MHKLLTTTSLSLLLLSGCTTKVHLAYHPITPVTHKNDVPLFIEKFESENDPNRIGTIRNLYGMPVIKVTSYENLSSYITDAFSTELGNAGYHICKAPIGQAYTIEGKIVKAHTNLYFTFSTKFVVDISLKQNQKTLFSKQYSMKNNSYKFVTFAHEFGNSLEERIQEFAAEFIHDLKEVLQDQPQDPFVLSVSI